MDIKKRALTGALMGLAVLGSSVIATDALAGGKEKCYGISKAGENDCATKTSSCAGTSKTDYQKDAFKLVPKGKCSSIKGGNLKSS